MSNLIKFAVKKFKLKKGKGEVEFIGFYLDVTDTRYRFVNLSDCSIESVASLKDVLLVSTVRLAPDVRQVYDDYAAKYKAVRKATATSTVLEIESAKRDLDQIYHEVQLIKANQQGHVSKLSVFNDLRNRGVTVSQKEINTANYVGHIRKVTLVCPSAETDPYFKQFMPEGTYVGGYSIADTTKQCYKDLISRAVVAHTQLNSDLIKQLRSYYGGLDACLRIADDGVGVTSLEITFKLYFKLPNSGLKLADYANLVEAVELVKARAKFTTDVFK